MSLSGSTSMELCYARLTSLPERRILRTALSSGGSSVSTRTESQSKQEDQALAINNDDKLEYLVVVNSEEQYSIWPSGRAIPAGWSPVGEAAPKVKCLEHIERIWTDMRPRSLREIMERQGN